MNIDLEHFSDYCYWRWGSLFDLESNISLKMYRAGKRPKKQSEYQSLLDMVDELIRHYLNTQEWYIAYQESLDTHIANIRDNPAYQVEFADY